MTRKNRHFQPAEKIRILKRHLLDREPISAVCTSEKITPQQFYDWQKRFFENGAAAFEKTNSRAESAKDQRIEKLESTLQRKDAVIAQITEEHIQLKKDLGEI